MYCAIFSLCDSALHSLYSNTACGWKREMWVTKGIGVNIFSYQFGTTEGGARNQERIDLRQSLTGWCQKLLPYNCHKAPRLSVAQCWCRKAGLYFRAARLVFSSTCWHSVQNILSSSLLSRNITNYGTVILPVVLYGCETWYVYGKNIGRERVFRRGCWGKYSGVRERSLDETGENWRMGSLVIFLSQNIIRVIE